MLSIAVVEDDIKYSATLKNYLVKYKDENKEDFEVDFFMNGYDFLESYEKKTYSIILLDIVMPGFDGLEVAKSVRRTDENASIIFVTNMAQYAIKGYEVNALDFVVKPINYINFSLKLEKAINLQKRSTSKKLVLDCVQGKIVLRIDEIYYL